MEDEQRQFRNALGCFATGVTVVTAPAASGDPIGMTVSSFNSVSLDPPLVVFSIGKWAHSLEVLQDSPSYAVNVLGRDQMELSNRFARPGTDKWHGVNWKEGTHGVPLLDGAIATFECEPFAVHEGGDHLVFLGRVTRYESVPAGEPLVFFRGGYVGVSPLALP